MTAADGASRPQPPETRHRGWIRAAREQVDAALGDVGGVDGGAGGGHSIPVDAIAGYALERELHRGGQGVVYLAVQRSTQRRVAIKVLREGVFADALERARFEREVRMLATLRHPNIVTIHDSGVAGGRFYFAMDYIPGQPLDAFIADRKLGVRDTLRLFGTICEAVNAAHARGIIHRDLKPANVRVDAGGTPYVLDFGLAKEIVAPAADAPQRAATATGQFVGSLPWAAPEQAECRPDRVDMRTDVYALGMLLYHALAGRFPYAVACDARTLLDNIVSAAPLPLRAVRRDLDDDVETIVLKCLSKERERRYQTAGELGRDIRRYLAGEPIDAKRDSAWYMLRKSVARYRKRVAVAGLFLALLFGSTVVTSLLLVRANRAADRTRKAEAAARLAERAAVGSLRQALVAQARALRRSGWAGQRVAALAALARADRGAGVVELRNEAIAALALTDLRPVRRIPGNVATYFDPTWTHHAMMDAGGAIRVARTADDGEVARIPPPECAVRELYAPVLRGAYLARRFDPREGPRHLEVWELESARCVLRVSDLPERGGFAFSPDGRQLAVGRRDQAIHVYDLATGRAIRRCVLDRSPAYLDYDPAGRRLVLYHESFTRAELLDLESGRREPAFASDSIAWSVAWHPHAPILAGATGWDVELWHTDQRRSVARLRGHQDQVVRVEFAADGALLLSYSWDGVAIVWDVSSRRPLVRAALVNPTFGPDGRRVAGGRSENDGYVTMVYELEPAVWRCLSTWGGDIVPATASGGFEPRTGLLVLCHTDGAVAAALHVYDVAAGEEALFRPLELPTWLALGSGDAIFAAQQTGLARWPLRIESESGRIVIEPPEPLLTYPGAETIALSADAGVVVTGSLGEGRFRALDVRSGGSRDFAAAGRVTAVQVSAEGRWIAAGGWDRTGVEVWEAATGKCVARLSTKGMSYVAFSPDSAVMVTSDAEGVVVWETGTWRPLRRTGQRGALCGFSPDGRLLVMNPDRKRLCLLSVETLAEVAALEPPDGAYSTGCAFRADGEVLAQFVNLSGVAYVWDLRALRAELELLGLDW